MPSSAGSPGQAKAWLVACMPIVLSSLQEPLCGHHPPETWALLPAIARDSGPMCRLGTLALAR